MAKYLVNVIMSTCGEVEVEAENEEEARRLEFMFTAIPTFLIVL